MRAIGIEPATQMADRLRRMVEAIRIPFDGKELKVTVSIGVAEYPSTPAKNIDEMIEAADKALYRAKNDGRNRVSR